MSPSVRLLLTSPAPAETFPANLFPIHLLLRLLVRSVPSDVLKAIPVRRLIQPATWRFLLIPTWPAVPVRSAKPFSPMLSLTFPVLYAETHEMWTSRWSLLAHLLALVPN